MMNNESAPTSMKFLSVLAMVPWLFWSATLHADSADESQITEIIGAIEQGWENADGAPFREHFLDFDGARYIESGGQNTGLTDLIEHHVETEGDALDSLELNFSNIEIQQEGDFAWAIVDVEVVAVVKADKRRIHNRGYQTFLFRAINGDWKVVHTHSSSRPVKKADKDHAH